ncbi:Imm1 family immunity protein [Allokutzneria sp. NRRL B-24872]|uniref:Imm1 family immunity protein n=1 Tax=Allokutzneria sp. NRRL B-24872 TaxID=1137961 RepID=UPI001AEFDC58|nr:Imm1 family immunity protein [Allokutzneria sp. NRRL B-24872]
MRSGRLETWLTSSSGRSLAFVSNTARAVVVLMNDDDDPGEHAVDPGASGSSSGFVLENGQHDAYPDADTLPLADALRVVDHILASGAPPEDVEWSVDR